MDSNPPTDPALELPSPEASGGPPMSRAEIVRETLNANLPLLVFLGFYFAATVLGNFIYNTTWAQTWAQSALTGGFDFSKLPTMRTPGYWILLLMPFAIAPPLAIYSARAVRALLNRVTFRMPEFRRMDYLVIAGIAYVYCYHEFRRAHVTEILANGVADAWASVAARFEILEALGFWPPMVMKSVLVFLAVYSLVRAMRSREWFWIGAFLINLILLSEMLIWLNMKWPVLIYYIALVLCIFLFSQRHPYRNTVIAGIGLLVTYLAISVVVLRFAEAAIISQKTGNRADPQSYRTYTWERFAEPRLRGIHNEFRSGSVPIDSSEYTAEVARNSVSLAPLLVMNAVNRMALPYPFYYQVFTENGPICGTIVDRILRKTNPCHPSSLIYEEMYGDDNFGGRATAPAAVHITGYALGGWSGALIATVLASLVIGSFMGLWRSARTSTLAAAVFVMGGYSAYFFSQLPFEGPLVYDHGVLWWAAVLVGYAGYRLFLAPALSTAVFAPIGRWAAPALATPGVQKAVDRIMALRDRAAEGLHTFGSAAAERLTAGTAGRFVMKILPKSRSDWRDSKTPPESASNTRIGRPFQ